MAQRGHARDQQGQRYRLKDEVPSVVEVLEGATKRAVSALQDYSQLSFRALTNLPTPPHYFQDTLEQMDDVGVGSVPIILLKRVLKIMRGSR